jgi:hypothetical protein
MPKVDIGIACSKGQSSNWWQPVMAELLAEQKAGIEIGRIHAVASAMPDHNKNHILDDRRMRRTDTNRNKAAAGFLQGDAEWMWWLDDDTVPPKGALSHLLSLQKEAVGIPYVLAKPPHNPLAYMRSKDTGLYSAVWDFPMGSIIRVDSIGMGCTLTHRSIFEKIQTNFVEYQRPNGSFYPVHRSRIDTASLPENNPYAAGGQERVEGMNLITPLRQRDVDDPRPFPFFAMEYARTEDHFFWELAAQVGVHPFVDTFVWCRHIREYDFGLEHLQQMQAVEKERLAKENESS